MKRLMCAYACTCMHMQVHVSLSIHVYVCMCISVCVDLCLCVGVCMNEHVFVCLFHKLLSANCVLLVMYKGEAHISTSLLLPPFSIQYVTL